MSSLNEFTSDGKNKSHMVGEPSLLQFAQVSSVHIPPKSAKIMSTAALNAAIEHEIRMGKLDPNMDKKQMRRVISNRYAAKKSHDKKLNKVAELEKSQKELEGTVANLRPRIEHEQDVQSHLGLEKEMLVERLQTTTDISNLRAAEITNNILERDWWKELHIMQTQMQMQATAGTPAPPPPPQYN